MRLTVTSVLIAVSLWTCAGSAFARTDPRTYAMSLLQEGRRRIAMGSFDRRREGLAMFEDAALVAPHDPEVLVALGDAYIDARYLHRARTVYDRALAVAPGDADVRYGYARMRRREWLDSGWASDLEEAIEQARQATQLRPDFAQAWEALSALAVEDGDVPGAREAAERALAAAPSSPQAQLAAAGLAYRSGEIARADSLFRLGIAGLDSATAAHFADISPLLPERDNKARSWLPAAQRAELVRQFWSAHDPDPATPQNEAELEYWSRQAHALLLLGDPWGSTWRERTAVYVRYGRQVQVEDPMGSRRYEMPRLDLGEVAESPTPQQLERLDQITAGGGQSAFAPLPPGAEPLPISARVVRFEGDEGPRLLAQVQAQGTPGDELTADAVVVDASEHVVASASRALTPSACDPATLRAGDFAFPVAPGSYRVAISVHDAGKRRGVKRVACDALPVTHDLAMSEIAPNCGPPELATAREGVRLNPNPNAHVVGSDPLVAYFEIYHLGTEGRNESRFEYEYQLRELGAPGVPWFRQRMDGSAAAATLAYKTVQSGVGPLRRQFISVPTRVLPAGRYEIEIDVHDLVSGRSVSETMTFARLWSDEELSGAAPVPVGGQ